jgi:hypothetical protein
MKTPRQLLIEQHSTADARLAQIQTQVLSQTLRSVPLAGHRESRVVLACRLFWQEIICPARYVWTGFAAVWLLILAVHLQDAALISRTAKAAPPSADALQAWKEQQSLAVELANPTAIYRAENSKTAAPAPRSERRKTSLIG